MESPSLVHTWIDPGNTAPGFVVVHVAIVAGTGTGSSTQMDGERLVIGTHESAGIVVTDPLVSRFHCELVRSGEQLLVRDLGSRNGTFLDGVLLREAFAKPGSLLAVGQTVLRITAGTGTVTIPESASDRFGNLVGRSAAMRRMFLQLERAAASDATVLLLGETGTGKEVAAESIHEASPRASGPFVVVDCGAIPAELLESELFGHEKGSFTGAVRSRDGAFQAAHGGTIFLDEIGEMPRDLQPKLLRALSRRAVKPVGREAYVDVDVRVIAATNRDLRAEVNAERFRDDLYFRLAVVEVQLPPLRERADDVPVLVESFIAELPEPRQRTIRPRVPELLDAIAGHRWPGNVRELRNVVERWLALGQVPAFGEVIARPVDDGNVPIDLGRPFKDARDEWTARFERAYLAALLEHHGGNIRAASRAAGIDRVHMYRLLSKHGLR